MKHAIDIFRYQHQKCEPYRRWCDLLGVSPQTVDRIERVPFLPIEFFRTHRIYCGSSAPELTFSSSGTTDDNTSRHYVARAQRYIESFTAGFEQFYGSPTQYSIFALLPGYLERPDSSLVYMVEHLQRASGLGGFFLNDLDEFERQLVAAGERGEKIFVIGVTFALVDFAKTRRVNLGDHAIVMETGGMKGRARQIERGHLHALLCHAFGVARIHSEYGMTEMLSQAYSSGGGIFRPTESMTVWGRSLVDPLRIVGGGDEIVGLNIVDLSNIDSCSFIATGDCGRVLPDGTFTVRGRIPGEIIRGCNMLL